MLSCQGETGIAQPGLKVIAKASVQAARRSFSSVLKKSRGMAFPEDPRSNSLAENKNKYTDK